MLLQITFNWKNSHLHDYEIFLKPKDDNVIPINQDKPALNLVSSKEAFNYREDIPMETGLKLADYLSSAIVYNYNFGDGWEHTIEGENLIDNFD